MKRHVSKDVQGGNSTAEKPIYKGPVVGAEPAMYRSDGLMRKRAKQKGRHRRRTVTKSRFQISNLKCGKLLYLAAMGGYPSRDAPIEKI